MTRNTFSSLIFITFVIMINVITLLPTIITVTGQEDSCLVFPTPSSAMESKIVATYTTIPLPSDAKNYTSTCPKTNGALQWTVTFGRTNYFLLHLFGFSTSIPNKIKSSMLTDGNGRQYYSTLARSDDTTSTIPTINGWKQANRLNITVGELLENSKSVYNLFAITNRANLLPIQIDFSNILKDKMSLSGYQKPNKTDDEALFRSGSLISKNSFSSNKYDISMDFQYVSTNCLYDLLGETSNTTSISNLYFFSLEIDYYEFLTMKWNDTISSNWNNNMKRWFGFFDVSNILTSSSATSTKTMNDVVKHVKDLQSNLQQTTYSLQTFNAKQCQATISNFQSTATDVYVKMRYARYAIILTFSLAILLVLLISHKEQPIKSRFLINAFVCAIAVLYSLLALIFQAQNLAIIEMISAFEVEFYLVLGFLYVLSALRYFFTRNLYRTIRVQFTKKPNKQEKRKTMKEESKKKDDNRLQTLRILSKLANWKIFMVAIIMVLLVVTALCIFLIVVVAAKVQVSTSVTDISTYIKLAALLGLVVPTGILSILIDLIVNGKSLFVKAKVRWYFFFDDPLYYRLEFLFFIPAVIFGIILFILDMRHRTISKYQIETIITSYIVHGLFFILLELSLLIIGCAGFICFVHVLQKVAVVLRQRRCDGKSELTTQDNVGKKTDFEIYLEDDEARHILQQYCEREFSLENYLIFELVEQLEKYVKVEGGKKKANTNFLMEGLKDQHNNDVNSSNDSIADKGIIVNPTLGVIVNNSNKFGGSNSDIGSSISTSPMTEDSLLQHPPSPPNNNGNNNITGTTLTSNAVSTLSLSSANTTNTSNSNIIALTNNNNAISQSSSTIVTNNNNNNHNHGKTTKEATTQIDKIVSKMMTTYLNESSVLEVNLPNSTKKQVVANFTLRMKSMQNTNGIREPIDIDALSLMKQDVFHNLKDTFARLQLTNEYQFYKKKKQLEKELNANIDVKGE
ncbi:hypothetical protein ABK040_006883 [Willaertia magna]